MHTNDFGLFRISKQCRFRCRWECLKIPPGSKVVKLRKWPFLAYGVLFFLLSFQRLTPAHWSNWLLPNRFGFLYRASSISRDFFFCISNFSPLASFQKSLRLGSFLRWWLNGTDFQLSSYCRTGFKFCTEFLDEYFSDYFFWFYKFQFFFISKNSLRWRFIVADEKGK